MDCTFFPFAGQIRGRIPWRAALPGWPAILMGTVLWLAASWAQAPLAADGRNLALDRLTR